jgi:hypothetical protein
MQAALKINSVTILTLVLVLLGALHCAAVANAQAAKALLLFGGEGHKTFLGCLNCVSTSSGSVCNQFSDFGNKFNSDSIWNQFGDFGNQFSSDSPWNQFSSDGPVIVDKDGHSYGYFTINEFHDQTRIPWLLKILHFYKQTGNLDNTREMMCGD